VRDVRRASYGLFQDAFVETIVNFGTLENVMVLQFTEGVALAPFAAAPPL